MDKIMVTAAEKYLYESKVGDDVDVTEGMFGGGKTKEEQLAKSMARILKSKALALGINPKDVLTYMSTKL
jgi:hypothetical protein